MSDVQERNQNEATNAGAKNDKEAEASADSSDDWKIQRDAEKQLGDASFRSGDYPTAIHHYTAALSVDPEYAVVLSNRSACYMKMGERSRALHDAQACVRLGFQKGYSRLAAALQSLGRYQAALENWNIVLKDDPGNVAAQQGLQACQEQINLQKQAEAEPEEEAEPTTSATTTSNDGAAGNGDDDLDDFFNDVEEAASEVIKEKQQLAAASEQPQATNAIKHHKKGLGTAEEQIDRILATNYQWRNLNPFYVLDVPHTASKDDISRRFKALSLLLHPDKNPNHDRAQAAYDQVLKAKAALDDELKFNHVRQLVEQGMKQGKVDWERQKSSLGNNNHGTASLEDCQAKAVQRIFAQIEHNRRQVEQRERNHEQREREKEEEEAAKERNERKFDKNWKQEERVEKRIGDWRDFSKQTRPKI